MTTQSDIGQAEWRARRSTYVGELTEQVTAAAAAQMHTWAERGRIPWWVRTKERLRGRRVEIPSRGGTR
jgi:hypothetical protein